MKGNISTALLSLFGALAVSTAGAASVSVSPGGATTFAGTASFQINGPSIDYKGSNCVMNLAGTINPSTGALAITSAELPTDCGETTSGTSPIFLGADGLPWTGTTAPYSSSWRTTMSNLAIEFFDGSGWGPPWFAGCTISSPLTLDWYRSGSKIAILSSSGFKQFATTANGRTCHINMTLYLTPQQTFTTVP